MNEFHEWIFPGDKNSSVSKLISRNGYNIAFMDIYVKPKMLSKLKIITINCTIFLTFFIRTDFKEKNHIY